MTAPYSKCTVCGTSRTRAEWRALPLVGVWVFREVAEDGETDTTVRELRNCPCGAIPATLSVSLAEPLEIDSFIGGPKDLVDGLVDALADLQAELSRVRDLHRRTILQNARRALEARPAPPEPHLGQVGRDPPGYAYLARVILERNAGEGLEDDVRAELRAAYQDGGNRVREERAAATLAEPSETLHGPDCERAKPGWRPGNGCHCPVEGSVARLDPGTVAAVVGWMRGIPASWREDWGLNATEEIADLLGSGLWLLDGEGGET